MVRTHPRNIPDANNKGADQTAHCSLINTFVVLCLNSTEVILAIIQL